jgi:hypothetical protein
MYKSLWVVITMRKRRFRLVTRRVLHADAIPVAVPSRRSVLGCCGLLGTATLAGCADLSDVTRGPPPYSRWVYDPTERFGAERVGYASLDVERFAAARDGLPESVTGLLDRFDRQVGSVDLGDLTRLTAVGFGSLEAGRAGLTLVAEGSFDPGALREEYRMRRDDEWTRLDPRGDHDCWAYEAPFLASLPEYRGPDQERAPSVTAGVALAEESVVVGATLATDLRGRAAMYAALDAAADPAARYVTVDRPARDVSDTLEDEPFVLGVNEAVVEALAAEVPADQPLLREVLDGLRAIGLGTRAGEEPSTTLALVYDPGEFASLDTVRTVVEEVADGDDVGDDGARVSVGLAQGGRVVVVSAAIGPSDLLAGLDGVDL